MQYKINSEITAIRNASEIMSDHVLMWAKQEVALRTQALEAEQKKLDVTSKSMQMVQIHPPTLMMSSVWQEVW